MSNFQTYELLPKEIYTIYGEAGLRWLDPKIIGVLEFVRSTFGKPVIVNDWYMGGQFNERSIRIPGHTHYDWRKPGHPSGRAVDFDVQGVPSFEVQQYLLKNPSTSSELKRLGWTGLENGTSGWTHISVENFAGWDSLTLLNGIRLIPIS